MKQKPAQLPWFITGASGVLTVSGLALWALAIVRADVLIGLPSHQLTTPISGLTFAALGGLVLSRHPRHPIGWMLAGLGLISGVEVLNLGFMTYRSLLAPGGVIRAPEQSHWLAQWIWSPRSTVSFTFLLLLFPNGHLPSPRWRPVAWMTLLSLAASTVTAAFAPASWEAMGGIVYNPFAVQSPLLIPLQVASSGVLSLSTLCCMASPIVRFHNARGIERQQLKWMVYAVGFLVLICVASGALVMLVPDGRLALEVVFSMINIASIGIAIAATIAVLRHHLYDIDVLINRTMVYGTLTMLVAISYVLIVGFIGAAFQSSGSLLISLFATGVIAVLFQPVREWVQRRVDRMLYGERDHPYQVLSNLGRQLEGVETPDAMLTTIVETIAQMLNLPWVSIRLPTVDGEDITAEIGHSRWEEVEIPLYSQGSLLGWLKCSPRDRNAHFRPDEEQLLRDIAVQAAVAVRASLLSAALQRSRKRLVSAREEERRRLRRDLHDGLGPQLASMALKIDAVRNHLERDPEAAERILGQLRAQVTDAIVDIRRLVDNLRPPVLDELGLLPALRAATAKFSGAFPRIVVEGPAEVPSLPAAVEVAAFRIVQEAVTNVARHAHAEHCLVRLSLDGGLAVEIEDDGHGFPEHFGGGVGLHSMRERTLELGGSFAIHSTPEGGSRVSAHFPLPAVEP